MSIFLQKLLISVVFRKLFKLAEEDSIFSFERFCRLTDDWLTDKEQISMYNFFRTFFWEDVYIPLRTDTDDININSESGKADENVKQQALNWDLVPFSFSPPPDANFLETEAGALPSKDEGH